MLSWRWPSVVSEVAGVVLEVAWCLLGRWLLSCCRCFVVLLLGGGCCLLGGALFFLGGALLSSWRRFDALAIFPEAHESSKEEEVRSRHL